MQGRHPCGENAEATNGTVAREKQRQGTRESRRLEAEPGIAKTRLLLEGEDRLDVLDTEALQDRGRLRLNAQHQQAVAQLGALGIVAPSGTVIPSLASVQAGCNRPLSRPCFTLSCLLCGNSRHSINAKSLHCRTFMRNRVKKTQKQCEA